MRTKFWIVWRKNGAMPVYTHNSATSALAEAKRLARENTGETFVVLESKLAVTKRDLDIVSFDEEITDADTPF